MPDANFNGTDTFTVTITDDDGNAGRDISVTVSQVNDAATIWRIPQELEMKIQRSQEH